MFDFSQLRCFVAVAEELHFGRAAERLHMTQPPLSRQVQMLEHALGVLLLERTSRSVRLTPAGRLFLAEARRLLQLAEGAGLAARRAARGEAGSIALACTAAASYGFLPRLVALARAEASGIELILSEMVTADQLEGLAAGRIDIGLLRRLPLDRRGIDSACVVREPLLLAVPQGHRLASGEPPAIRDLEGQDFIAWAPVEARYFHELVGGLLRSAGVTTRDVQFISQTHTILALVNAGIGLALVPEAARILHFEGVVLRPLRGAERTLAELHMVWRPDNPNPALPVFRDLALNSQSARPAAEAPDS